MDSAAPRDRKRHLTAGALTGVSEHPLVERNEQGIALSLHDYDDVSAEGMSKKLTVAPEHGTVLVAETLQYLCRPFDIR